MFTYLAGLMGRQNVSSSKRRSTSGAIRSQVESCEQRMYLTGGVVFGPAFDGVVVDQPPVENFNPDPVPAAAASFTGEWKHSFDHMTLTQTGKRVKGEVTSIGIAKAKLKGVAEGGELVAVIRGKGVHPTLGIGRFRIKLDLTMSDADHLNGTSQTIFKKNDLGAHSVTFTREV